jgi:alkyl hydroperoxide reductase subunit AhpF
VRRHSVLRGRLGRLAAHAEHGAESSLMTRPSPFGEYDLLVIGADDASRRAAVEAAADGLRVVLVESREALDAMERAA